MTGAPTLKDVLDNAFREIAPKAYGGFWEDILNDDTSGDHYDLNGSVNADRLAAAISDHFLNPERVRAALVTALGIHASRSALQRRADFDLATDLVDDVLIDRLIAGLAGGSE